MQRPSLVFLTALCLWGCSGSDDPLGGPPLIRLSVDLVDLGSVPLESTGEAAVTVYNDGGQTLELLSISLVNGDDDVWSTRREPEASEVAGGQSLELIVQFSPDREGTEERAEFQIRSNDATTGSVYVDAVGTGALSTADNDDDGHSRADGDCDDADDTVYPGAPELCDGRDNNCDDSVPANEADGDSDGYRLCDDDCDDGNNTVYPGAEEICDDLDNDCDDVVPDRLDVDDDGVDICGGDCDDNNPDVSPNEPEVCDGVDNDCDDGIDDIDADEDGHSVCHPAGDCDDADPDAYPVVVDLDWAGPEEGTDEEPYATIDAALGGLDAVCRTVWLSPGTYTETLSVDGLPAFRIMGDSVEAVVWTPANGWPALSLSNLADVTLQSLTLTGASNLGDGGAVHSVYSALSLVDVLVQGNRASGDGGGVSVSGGRLTLVDAVFDANIADDDGGAVTIVNGILDDTSGTIYTGNTAARGGALLLSGSAVALHGAHVEGNSASESGGGVQVDGASSLEVLRSAFWSNTAATGGGGLSLVDVDDGASVVANNRFQDNDGGTHGGGAAIQGSEAAFSFRNNSFAHNTATGDGAGLYAGAAEQTGLGILSNIVGWSDGTSGLYVLSAAGATASHNIGYSTTRGDDFAGAVSAGADDNLSTDPLWASRSDDADPSNDDLSLSTGSPAIDTGPTDSTYDDLDGSTNDRGYTGGPDAL